MILKDLRVRESRLFSYVVASADMWFSAVNERTLYLRNDPEVGPVVRGEICDVGPGCHANLSQALLEYALSCDGCQNPAKADELIHCMGDRLGHILAKKLYQDAPDLPVMDQVGGAFEFIIHSMGFQSQMEQSANRIRYGLDCCPLVETAQKEGLMRGVVSARGGFIAICASMLDTLAPEWVMLRPTAREADDPLSEIVLQY